MSDRENDTTDSQIKGVFNELSDEHLPLTSYHEQAVSTNPIQEIINHKSKCNVLSYLKNSQPLYAYSFKIGLEQPCTNDKK